MTVKTITETVNVQRKVYVAEDGQEFDTEFLCLQHEDLLQFDRLTEAFDAMRIDTQLSDWIPSLFSRYVDDDSWYIIVPRTESDLDVLHEMFDGVYLPNVKYLVIVHDIYERTCWEFADIVSIKDMINECCQTIRTYTSILADD